MSVIAENFREYFSRHFLGKVKVRSLSHRPVPPRVFSFRRLPETRSVRIKMNIEGAKMFWVSENASFVRNFRFSEQFLRVRGERIASYAREEIRVNAVKLRKKTKTLAGKKRMQILPQERINRLQWLSPRSLNGFAKDFTKEKEIVLGWFGPVIEEAVVNLVLNKQQGTLLIWYNPQSRRYVPRGLCLYRRLGIDEKPKWRWV